MRHLFLPLAAVLLSTSGLSQVPKDQLDKPPANARHFTIQSTGGKHGDEWVWQLPDGTRKARFSMNLRGQVWEEDYTGKPGADGFPASVTIRGVSPQGDVNETFNLTGGVANWQSPIDKGSSNSVRGRFYTTIGGPMDTNAWFIERLLASPGKKMALLPGGEARAEKLTTMIVGKGKAAKPITLWQVVGVSNTPVPIWTDAKGKFFAVANGMAWLPDGFTGEQKRMEKVQ